MALFFPPVLPLAGPEAPPPEDVDDAIARGGGQSSAAAAEPAASAGATPSSSMVPVHLVTGTGQIFVTPSEVAICPGLIALHSSPFLLLAVRCAPPFTKTHTDTRAVEAISLPGKV